MLKLSELLTQLQPHQQRALERGLKDDILLAHATGSGKTLTSIAIADALNKPTVVLTPASLVENYKKEIAKHLTNGDKFQVYSLPTAVERNIQIAPGSTVIVDEAHSLRNSGTARYKYVKDQLKNAGRVIALTGTPAYNRVEDIGPILNAITRKPLLPDNPTLFNKVYIDQEEVPSGMINSLLGAKAGVKYHIRHKDRLKNILNKYVDVFEKEVEKPKVEYDDHYVDMDKDQQAMYKYVQDKLPLWLKLKLWSNLPPSKQEAQQMNTFLTGVRQVANTPEAYQKKKKTTGTKIKEMARILKEEYAKNPKLRALVYSNFKESGIDSLAKLLDESQIPYERFHGGLTAKQKKAIVDRYNAGELPVILGTGSASEGLDLKQTNLIQLMEPHFNNARLEQVIGRGVRYKSHEGLPEDQRKVRIQRFFSRFPPGTISALLGKDGKITVDEYLKTRADEKDDLIREVKELFK